MPIFAFTLQGQVCPRPPTLPKSGTSVVVSGGPSPSVVHSPSLSHISGLFPGPHRSSPVPCPYSSARTTKSGTKNRIHAEVVLASAARPRGPHPRGEGGSEEAQGVSEGLRVLGLMASKWEVLQPWEAGSIPGWPGPPVSHPLPLRLHSVPVCLPRGPHLSVKQAHPVMFSRSPPLLQSFIHCSVRVM